MGCLALIPCYGNSRMHLPILSSGISTDNPSADSVQAQFTRKAAASLEPSADMYNSVNSAVDGSTAVIDADGSLAQERRPLVQKYSACVERPKI